MKKSLDNAIDNNAIDVAHHLSSSRTHEADLMLNLFKDEKSVCCERSNVSRESHQPVSRVGSERSNVRNQYCGLIGWVGLL